MMATHFKGILKEHMIKEDAPNWFRDAKLDAADYFLYDGEISWYNGSFSGVWEFGEWHNGKFYNGVWLDGFWYNGIFENAVWVSGKWKKGKIFNKSKSLCVKSKVSPKCFFKPSETISIKGIYT